MKPYAFKRSTSVCAYRVHYGQTVSMWPTEFQLAQPPPREVRVVPLHLHVLLEGGPAVVLAVVAGAPAAQPRCSGTHVAFESKL
jgi:hypothetical protein